MPRQIATASTAGGDPGPGRVQAGGDRRRTRSGAVASRPTPTPACVGVIAWMHTFSPAKMWIAGLARAAASRSVHLHTQFNRDIPWATIDMDFMNLNQSAHGDREFGFIAARLRLNRKVVVGHWQDAEVQARLGVVGARRRRLARCADAADRPLRRQHARGRGHRGRQGRGADAARLLGQRLRRGRSRRARAEAVSDAEVDALVDEYEATLRPSRRSSAPGGERHASLRDGGADRDRPARLPRRRRVQRRSPTPSRICTASTQLPGLARPAADGRRLRLRRRGRLEDRRAGAAR